MRYVVVRGGPAHTDLLFSIYAGDSHTHSDDDYSYEDTDYRTTLTEHINIEAEPFYMAK